VIKLNCDNCEKTFEVESKEAGGKVPCPHCGDINRVPAEEASTSDPAPTHLPPKTEAEQPVCVIRPAMFRAHPFRYLLIMAFLLGGLVLVFAAWLAEAVPFWLIWAGAVVAVVAGLALVRWWVRTNRWIKVTISNKRTIREEGIIRRHTTEVLHDHVRSVDINQDFIQRIFNVGYIGIDSAGQDGIEIEIRDIPGPHRVKEVIDRYRKM